jgi:hypothetical protein
VKTQTFATDAEGVWSYEMIYIEKESAFFVIGGRFRTTSGSYDVATIAKYRNGAWSDAGQLTQPRYVSF